MIELNIEESLLIDGGKNAIFGFIFDVATGVVDGYREVVQTSYNAGYQFGSYVEGLFK